MYWRVAVFETLVDISRSRMTADILGKVEQLQVLAKKQDRRLKDIHIWCQWVTGMSKKSKAKTQRIEYSGFTASQFITILGFSSKSSDWGPI
jgi:hypothetical protein